MLFRLLTFSLCMLFLAYQHTDGIQFADDDTDEDNQKWSRMKVDDWPMQTNSVDINASSGSFSNHLTSSNYEKRNINDHLKHTCSCVSKRDAKYMGPNVFPHYHETIVCDNENTAQNKGVCKFGYSCQEIYHKIRFLKIRDNTNDMTNFKSKKNDLPHDHHMRTHYEWETHEIPVDCRCMFPSKKL